MKIVTLICNIVLFVFTCLVLLTDGFSREAAYIVFTLVLLLVPVFNAVVIFRSGAREGWLDLTRKGKVPAERAKTDGKPSSGIFAKIAAITANIVMFSFACWAFADQYPHPKEDGLIAYIVLVLTIPVLSAVVIFYSGRGNGRLRIPEKK